MRTLPRGHTLPELLLTLALVAILFSVALPDFKQTLQTQAGETLINDLARNLANARAAAVTSGSMATLCPSNDGVSCNGEWQQGILLFTDNNADQVLNEHDRILRYSAPTVGKTGTLRLNSFPNREYLQFTPLGFTNKQSGNFTWCPPDDTAALAQQLIFNQSGRTRLAQDSDKDGIREGADGTTLSCD